MTYADERDDAEAGRADMAALLTPDPREWTPYDCDDCGHQAPTGWELAAHTLDTHGRTLTATERAPRTEVAA